MADDKLSISVTKDESLSKQNPVEDQTNESLEFDDSVLEKIVAITVQEVDGIIEMKGGILSAIQEGLGGIDLTKGVDVELIDNKAEINLSVIIEYGKQVPKIFAELKKVISQNLKEMTGLDLRALNVRVVDVLTREEIAKRQSYLEENDQVERGY
ncbi:MAG: Asp23/Gls24 family envelope stress response protein [Coriobacteriia bacterium]|nr:Asp23/Gls24 family envelope stress response protein [Coriobacteriia bacterium]